VNGWTHDTIAERRPAASATAINRFPGSVDLVPTSQQLKVIARLRRGLACFPIARLVALDHLPKRLEVASQYELSANNTGHYPS